MATGARATASTSTIVSLQIMAVNAGLTFGAPCANDTMLNSTTSG